MAAAAVACTDGGDPAGFVTEPEASARAGSGAASGLAASSAGACENGTAVPNPGRYPDLVADCEVLLSVKDSLRGTGALNWDAGTAIGDWDGVTLTASRVTGIELGKRELTGVVPGGLGGLGRLHRLALESNDLTGAIPAALGNLGELRRLTLSGNRLAGAIPAELTRAGSLSNVNLSDNRLTGAIPAGFGDLAHLDQLRLNGNDLSGSIPPELGDVEGLELLYLQRNDLTGTIPVELGELGRLEHLLLNGNELTGGIPSELGNLSSLTQLLMEENDLMGGIPAELGNLTRLRHLSLHANGLTGEIPEELGNLTRLTHLYLQSNQLTGWIPGHLTLLESLADLRLNGNRLVGCVPGDLGRFGAGISAQQDGTTLPMCTPGLSVNPTEGLETSEHGRGQTERPAFFTVRMVDRPAYDVTIDLSSSDPGEGVTRQTELVFTHTHWYITRTVAVVGVNDDARDGDQQYTIVLHPTKSEDPKWHGIDPPDVHLTNLDNEPEGAPIVVSFKAYPDTIPEHGEAFLHWNVQWETSVRIEPGVGEVTEDTVTVRPDSTTTYTLTAVNIDGETTAEATVTVVAPPSIASFRAVPDTIAQGQEARLEWSVQGADSVFVNGADVTESTQLAVAPQATTTYELIAVNTVDFKRQADTAEVTVTVEANGPPVADIAISGCDDGNYTCTYDASGSTDPEGNIASYSWDMGDGTALAGATVEHGYVVPDSFIVVLTVTDRFGAAGTADTVQVANRAPEADFAPACEGLACTFTSTATDAERNIATWAWDFGDGQSGSGETAAHTYVSGGSYDVLLTVTDSLGARDDATRTVLVAPLPVIDAFRAVPDTVTLGDAVQLAWEVEGAATLFIDPDVGSVTGAAEVAVVPDSTTTYTLTAVNAAGDSVTAGAGVTTVPPPDIRDFRAVPEAITEGQGTRLTWEVADADSLFIDPHVGVVTDSAGVTVRPDTSTTYTLTAVNPADSAVTEVARVLVFPPPAIASFQARPETITEGTSSVLAWEVSGADSIHIDNGVGVVTGRYSITVTPAGTTTYTLTALNVPDSAVAAQVTVTVVPPPVIVSFEATPSTIAPDASSTLAWVATGADSLFIDQNVGVVTGTSSTSVSPAETTDYTLTAVNAADSAVTASATVTVSPNQPPVARIAVRDCDDGNYNCTYDASGSTDPNDNIASYRWDMGDGTTLDGTTAQHGYAAPGRYTVVLTVTDSAGATATEDTVQVVNRAPVASFTPACEQLACTFTSTSTDDGAIESWTWDFGDGQSGSGETATHTYAAGGTYDVILTVTDELGAADDTTRTVLAAPLPVIASFRATPDTITRGDTARLTWTVQDADSVFLEPGFGNVTGSTGVAVTPDTTTTYTLAAANAGDSTVTAQVTVTALDPPVIVSFGADRSVVTDGDAATLSWETTGAATLHLSTVGIVTGRTSVSLVPPNTTVYTLTATNLADSSVTATYTVEVVPPPVIQSFTAGPATITAGGSSRLTWTVTGATSLNIDQGVGTVTDSAGATVRPNATTTYTLTAANAADSAATATARVTIRTPEVTLSATPARIPQQNGSSQLQWTITGASTGRLTGGGLDSVVGSTGTLNVNPTSTTTYTLTASNSSGTGTDDATVTVVPPPPPPTISADPAEIDEGDSSMLRWTGAVGGRLTGGGLDRAVTATDSLSVSPTSTTTYSLTASNVVNGVTQTSAAATVTVTVIPVPPPVLGPLSVDDDEIYNGESVELSWRAEHVTDVRINGVPVSGGSATRTPPSSATTTYTLTARDLRGDAVNGGSVTVTAVARPVLGPLSVDNDEIYNGESVELSWRAENVTDVRINGSPVSGGSATRTPASSATTTYALTARDLHGNVVNGGSVTVTAVEEPELGPLEVDEDWIFNGESVTLTWSASYVTDIEINGSSVSGGRLTVTPPAGETTYELTALDLHGNLVNGGTVTVTSVGWPVLGPLRVDNDEIYNGERVTLTWSASNVTDVRINGSAVSGGRVTVTPPSAATTTYTLTATDLHGNAVNGGSVAVTAVAEPELGPLEVDEDWIFNGESVRLTWEAENVTDERINGVPVSGGSATRTPPSSAETTYTLTARDLHGNAVNGGSVTVTAVGRPVLGPLEVDEDWIFNGESVTLRWAAANVTNVEINGSSVSGTNITLTPPSSATTTYTLTALNLHGDSINGGSVTVTAVGRPVLGPLEVDEDEIYNGESVTLRWTAANVTNVEINGSSVSGTHITLTPPLSATTTYTLTALDLHGDSINGGSATITSVARPVLSLSVSDHEIHQNDTVTLSWTALNVENARITAVPSSATVGPVDVGSHSQDVGPPLGVTTYSLRARDLHGTELDPVEVTVTATVPPPPEVTISASPTSITEGDTVTLIWTATNTNRREITPEVGALTGTSGSEKVTPGVGETTYTITGWNIVEVTDTDTVTVTVRHRPPVIDSFTVRPSTIYRGQTSTLSWGIRDATSARIEPGVGAVSPTTGTHVVKPSDDESYTLRATGPGGTADSTVTVSVNPNDDPVAAFSVSCANRACHFDATRSTNTIGTTSYSWDLGDGNADSGIEVDHTYASSYDSVYVTLTVSDQYGLSDRESMKLVFHDELFRAGNAAPSADFTADCNGLACTFTSTSTDDTGIESYLWSTGDDSAAGTTAVHEHTYDSAGTYTVTLVVRDGQGGLGAALYQIRVGDP